jgi:peptidoglycan glycosyltransferase
MRRRIAILAFVPLVALLVLLAVHARWLFTATKDPRFVRFMRRYDRRSNVEDILPPHGIAVDARGERLEVAASGSIFQHVLDDLSLEGGGRLVRLTVDSRLQRRAASLMNGRPGAVVALEPSTGRILALVSSPRAAYLNRALNGLYPPGSTFKVFMGAAAITDGYEPIFDCPADGWSPSRGTAPIRDVEAYDAIRRGKKWRGFGKIGMGQALIHSSNTYFAQLGAGFGTQRFAKAVGGARLRDGARVLASKAIALESAGGGVPEGIGNAALAPVAIGQGALQLTPLGVALFTAAVANDGLMLEPTLDPMAKPRLRARPFSIQAAAQMKAMMRAAVGNGTGKACDVTGLSVCGKTGTAQTDCGRDHSWFTCFAPERAPRIVVTVIVEHGGFGAVAALPIAREVLLEAEKAGMFR